MVWKNKHICVSLSRLKCIIWQNHFMDEAVRWYGAGIWTHNRGPVYSTSIFILLWIKAKCQLMSIAEKKWLKLFPPQSVLATLSVWVNGSRIEQDPSPSFLIILNQSRSWSSKTCPQMYSDCIPSLHFPLIILIQPHYLQPRLLRQLLTDASCSYFGPFVSSLRSHLKAFFTKAFQWLPIILRIEPEFAPLA